MTVGVAVICFSCMLAVIYLNPSLARPKSIFSLMGIIGLGLLSVNLWVDALYDRDEKKSDKENIPRVTASGEAMDTKDKLHSEFRKLVTAIVWHNAKSGDDLHLLVRKEGETEEKILICSADMEKAFLEAIKMVSEKCSLDRCPCKTNCDNQTVLQKIQNIRKNLEKKS